MQDKSESKDSASKDIFEVFDELMISITERTGTPKYPTGIQSLDQLIWGVHKKELLIVASRPSQGKTSLTLQIAWNLAKAGHKVLFVSLEMSSHAVLERIFCNEMGLHGWKLRKGFQEEIAKSKLLADKFRSRLITNPIWIVDDRGGKPNALGEMIISRKPDVVFIDHLQRIPSDGNKNRHEVLAEYIQACKYFSIRYDTAVVVASQINRQGSTAENAMDFMKGSGEIEEAADCLLQLRWIGKDDSMEPLNKYHVRVIKQRHGPIDSCDLDFQVEHYRFFDWTAESVIRNSK